VRTGAQMVVRPPTRRRAHAPGRSSRTTAQAIGVGFFGGAALAYTAARVRHAGSRLPNSGPPAHVDRPVPAVPDQERTDVSTAEAHPSRTPRSPAAGRR
jgi:hypothetical protein